MSAELEFVAQLKLIQSSLYRYGGPILMALGTISCIISLFVFSQRNLRKNPCSLYFIAYNISNFLLIYTSVLTTTLATGYSIDPSLYNLAFCRVRFYAMLLFDALSPSYLILASIDRILVTSTEATRRHKSNIRFALVSITTVTVFWILVHTHNLIFPDIIQLAPGYMSCYFQLGIYMTVISYYSLVVKEIIIPFTMIGLGIWTVRNVRRAVRVAPAIQVTGGTNTAHAKDRQLITILQMDISIYVIFNIMIAVVMLYQECTKRQSQTLVQSQLEAFLLVVSVFSTYIPYCISCFTNMLVSKSFRRQVTNLFLGT